QGLHVDGLQRGVIRGPCRAREHAEYPCEHRGAEEAIHQAGRLHSCDSLLALYSFRASAAGRSMYPPRLSGTISISVILAGVMSVILPSACPRWLPALTRCTRPSLVCTRAYICPPRRRVPTIFSVSSENCSRNSRLRLASGRMPP